MPTYTLRLFGPQAQLVGTDTLTVDADTPLTPAALRDRLAADHPALADSLPTSRIAADHAYADDATPLDPAAELALIGLISGG